MNELVNQVIAIYNFENEQGFTSPDIDLTCDYVANKNNLTLEELTQLQSLVNDKVTI